MIVVDPRTITEYVVESERALPVAEQSVFLLGVLTVGDEQHLVEQAELDTRGHSFALGVLRCGLKGWRNVCYSDGKEVPFEKDAAGRPTDVTLSHLPSSVRIELRDEVLRRARLSESDKEKPAPPL
jgi:hypothetical protein